MLENRVKTLLSQGKPAIGTWLTLGSFQSARLLGRMGFDWLTVDMEHNPVDIETAAVMFQLVAASGTAPLVRIPWNTGENIKRVLDCGAWGIVVPMVNSSEEATDAVAFAKHPPQGRRSLGGALHAASFETDPATYYQRSNDSTLVIIQSEHIRAVEAADRILAVPGIDACFIGPNDLAASMGLEPNLDPTHPDVLEAIAHVLAAARRNGVAPGIHVPTPEAANRRIGEGFQFVAIGSDMAYLVNGAKSTLDALTHREAAPAAEVARY